MSKLIACPCSASIQTAWPTDWKTARGQDGLEQNHMEELINRKPLERLHGQNGSGLWSCEKVWPPSTLNSLRRILASKGQGNIGKRVTGSLIYFTTFFWTTSRNLSIWDSSYPYVRTVLQTEPYLRNIRSVQTREQLIYNRPLDFQIWLRVIFFMWGNIKQTI